MTGKTWWEGEGRLPRQTEGRSSHLSTNGGSDFLASSKTGEAVCKSSHSTSCSFACGQIVPQVIGAAVLVNTVEFLGIQKYLSSLSTDWGAGDEALVGISHARYKRANRRSKAASYGRLAVGFVSLITRLTTHDHSCDLWSSNRQAFQLGRSAGLHAQHRRSQTLCAVNRHGAGPL